MFDKYEMHAMEAFREMHFRKECYMKKGQTAAQFEITLTATGIGDKITIKCCNCGKDMDVTNYDNW